MLIPLIFRLVTSTVPSATSIPAAPATTRVCGSTVKTIRRSESTDENQENRFMPSITSQARPSPTSTPMTDELRL